MRVLANSIPKAGTHLLHGCLTRLPGLFDADLHLELRQDVLQMRAWVLGLRDGAVLLGHLVHEPRFVELLKATDLAHVLMVRDPRDVVVSYAEFVPRRSDHYLHEHFLKLTPDERLMTTITGIATPVAWDTVALRDIGGVFRQFLAWQREPGTLLVRFEDLIGARGGGDDARQLDTIRALARHAGLQADEADLAGAAQATFDPGSRTFRRGRIGEWRERLRPEHLEAIERVAGDVLRQLGY